MAGYWPSSFLRVYGPRRSRGPYTRKNRTRPISSHLDRKNLVNKGYIIWLLVKFCLRDNKNNLIIIFITYRALFTITGPGCSKAGQR